MSAKVIFNSKLLARTSFWRALVEMTALITFLSLLYYPLRLFAGPPWPEIFAFPVFGLYALGAWRLEPGKGGLLRRGLRALVWGALLSLIVALLSWMCLTLVSYPGRIYGLRIDDLQLTLAESALNELLISLSVFVPTRTLLALWRAGRTRLRWQLTSSYLLVGVLTVAILPLSLVLFIGIASLFTMPLMVQPGDAAQRLGIALAPLVRRNAAPGEIDPLLKGLLDGGAHVPTTEQQAERDSDRPDNAAFSFEGVRRALVLRHDGVVLASSGAGAPTPGAALPASEAIRLGLLVEQVRAGGCTPGRSADGPLIDSAACAILDDRGALAATVIVENNYDARAQWSVAIVRIMTMTVAVTGVMFGIIPIAIVVVLLVSLGVGYPLARRLTRRLERLAAATGDVASGDLDRRVEVDSPDEVGRLGADFNAMAARLKERERALADEAARTDALLRANRRLVANVSHELRTPLATLRGYLEALEQEHGDHLPGHDLEVIQREARRLTELIDDLFTLARAEAQQLPLTIETVDAVALARRLVDTLAPLARRERQIEVVAALPADLPLVRADRARLEQVLLNLAYNALRHTPPGGIVAIEGAADEAGMVTLAVADTGVGIPAEELPLVFERFYRSDSSRARETGGAGLGLALVQELVTAMGGVVAAESTPGRGSRFSVALRRATPALEPVA